jgi:hypothetical protein
MNYVVGASTNIGDAPPRLFGKRADETSSSLPESKHTTHGDLSRFRPREGISRKTLRPACLSLLKKMSPAGVQGCRRWSLKASNLRRGPSIPTLLYLL